MDAPKRRKRHFNMAPKSSDLYIVDRARESLDEYATTFALDMGIGYRRLQRLIEEYSLEFKKLPVSDAQKYNKRPMKTPQDFLNAGRLANINGILCKKCSRCQVTKPVDQFHVSSEKTSGCVSACKSCLSRRKTPLLGGIAA